MKKMPKSFSTQNMSKNIRAGSLSSSSLKGTKTNFKFRKPFFFPLNPIPKEIEENLKNIKKNGKNKELYPLQKEEVFILHVYIMIIYISLVVKILLKVNYPI